MVTVVSQVTFVGDLLVPDYFELKEAVRARICAEGLSLVKVVGQARCSMSAQALSRWLSNDWSRHSAQRAAERIASISKSMRAWLKAKETEPPPPPFTFGCRHCGRHCGNACALNQH